MAAPVPLRALAVQPVLAVLPVLPVLAIVAMLAMLAVPATPGDVLAAADAPWQRTAPVGVPDGQCQELAIDRAGSGFLELRLTPEPLQPVGNDPKTSGTSVLVPAGGGSATILLYHTTGPYPLTVGVEGPLRWIREGRRICFASGSRVSACGVTNGDVRYAHVIPFGAGWEARVVPCASPLELPASGLPLASLWLVPLWAICGALFLLQIRHRPRIAELIASVPLIAVLGSATAAWVDPWWIDPRYALMALALVTVWSLIRVAKRRSAPSACVVGLSLACLVAAMLIPYPLRPGDAAHVIEDPAAPPLWVDPAYWHHRAPQQRLELATRSVASLLEADGQTWMVLGGSVTAGWKTGAAKAFTAMAQQDLVAQGDQIRLVNAGVPGWNLGQIDRFLLDVGDRLALDGIVLASVLNNATFRIVGPPAPPRCRTLLCQYAYNLRRNYLLAVVVNFFLPKPGNEEQFRETLDRIISRERKLGRHVVLLDETHDAQLRPRWYNSWLRRPHERYREILRQVAATHGESLHRVDDVVAALAIEDRFVDGMHLTNDAHAAVGRRLARILRDRTGDGSRSPDSRDLGGE